MLQGHRAKGYEARRKKRLPSSLSFSLDILHRPAEDSPLAFRDNCSSLGFLCHGLICFLGLDLFARGIPVSSSGTGSQQANACVTDGYVVMAVEEDGLD